MPSFTFTPHADWSGDNDTPGWHGNERRKVEAFAAVHPRLDPHFPVADDAAFDHGWDKLFAAMDCAPNMLVNFAAYHPLWQAAREAGCDVLLTGEWGNQSISNGGTWSYVEFFTHGCWGQWLKTLAARPGDPRGLAGKAASLTFLRLLPAAMREAIRTKRHPARGSINAMVSLLRSGAAEEAQDRAGKVGGTLRYEYPACRAAALAGDYAWMDTGGADVKQGFEQVYGLRQVDPLAFRPLLEFCAGLPTAQFSKDGVERRLARRLAQGRMPENQRTDPRQGRHQADWFERLGSQRDTLRAEIAAMRADPELAALFDTERMERLLDTWPDSAPTAPERAWPLMAGLPRAVLASRFLAHAEGRNRR